MQLMHSKRMTGKLCPSKIGSWSLLLWDKSLGLSGRLALNVPTFLGIFHPAYARPMMYIYIYTTIIFMWDQPYTLLCNYLKICLGMWASGNECLLSFGGGYSYGIMHGLCNKSSPVCHCGSHIAVEWMSFLFAAMTLTVFDHLIVKKWCATLQLGFYLSIFSGVAVAWFPPTFTKWWAYADPYLKFFPSICPLNCILAAGEGWEIANMIETTT